MAIDDSRTPGEDGIAGRVLNVDDELSLATLLQKLLRAQGYRVAIAADGAAALASIPDDPPDVILLDVVMPGMDGPATLLALRATESAAETPVVFLTAKTQPDEIARYRELGAAGVIPKPFDPMTLAALIREFYERAG